VSAVETEFLVISKAVARLEAGMFGGPITRPEPVKKLKKKQPRLSVGVEDRRKKAAKAILTVVLKGGLSVFVFDRSIADGARPIVVPIDVLRLMPKIRDGLPDRPVRPPFNLMRDRMVEPDLFAALSTSSFHSSRLEFDVWYKREKRKGRWLSQRESGQPRLGRPSKITSELLESITARRAENSWCASYGIAALVRLLVSKGAPNRNLLRRAVQQLFEETGDPAYRVVPRKRAKRESGSSRT
jgi:hypothetical protein